MNHGSTLGLGFRVVAAYREDTKIDICLTMHLSFAAKDFTYLATRRTLNLWASFLKLYDKV